MIKRYLCETIRELSFTDRKMAFVSGPRQCGKTTLAKDLIASRGSGAYWNWDDPDVKRKWSKNPNLIIQDISGESTTPILVFDEIHKAHNWKNPLKGFYDTLPIKADLLITGSARLNIYRRGSDSLMGRYYNFRLHPFSVAEVEGRPLRLSPCQWRDALFNEEGLPHPNKSAEEALQIMMLFGGFPEPFLKANTRSLRLWRRGRIEKLIREDLRDLSRIQEIGQIETLCALLPERVGSLGSNRSLQEDLTASYDSIVRWLNWLNEIYYCFEIKPYSKRISRSIKKAGKRYLWDYSEIKDEGARFENLIASHLLKACHFWTDSGEGDFSLFFLRDKEGLEIDFIITADGKPFLAVEAKTSESDPSPAWRRLFPQLDCRFGLQLVMRGGGCRVYEEGGRKLMVANAGRVLAGLV